VGAGKGAMGRIVYRVSASAFQDGTEMQPADLLYPFALAFRWGEGGPGRRPSIPTFAAATRLLRERLAGVRVLRVEERELAIADLTFRYRSPVVEVHLNGLSGDNDENALIAPPWSSVPWHVLALMEAAVERNIAAFSEGEAARRGVPWLDLARDKAQLERLASLIAEFAASGYRPAALEGLVGAEAATARWQALAKFLQDNGHLLVTNGPYQLASYTPQAYVFNVIRDFTYPVGIGTFDPFAYPRAPSSPHRARSAALPHLGRRRDRREGAAQPPPDAPAPDARPDARHLSDPAQRPLCRGRQRRAGRRRRQRRMGSRRTLCRAFARRPLPWQLPALGCYLHRRQQHRSSIGSIAFEAK
jgi:hypothetical protein